jgi:hypothetical protein
MFQLCGGPRLLAAAVMMVFAVTGILADGSVRFARAQEEMSFDFRETLDDHGRWVTHPRWGEVWVPTTTQENWRPYLLGHWVYTDEWGWYWLADEEWGWITYHYGRWVVDRDYGLGWIWVPGTQWSPAWVSWRQGDEVIGWAPMPPDEIYADAQDDPDVWVFVRASDIMAPAVAVVVLPAPQAAVFVSRATLISRTRVIQRSGQVIATNPGVSPSFVAAKIGRPIEAASIEPRFVHGTVGGEGTIVSRSNGSAPLPEIITPRARFMRPAINTPMASPTSPSRPPMEYQRSQRELNQPSWGAVHQPPPPQHAQSGAVQLPPRGDLPGTWNHRSPPKQHAAPQQQR